MIVYGRHAVREALRGPRTVSRVWATRRAARELGDPGDAAEVVEAEQVTERCGSAEHQGVCAAVSSYVYADAARLLEGAEPLVLALDQVQDPQNLGALCRTAEAAGVTGVVLPERRSAEVTPAVCRASAGAVEHLAVARVRNLVDFLAEAKRRGCWCYGAAAEGGRRYDEPDYRGGVVLALGAEGRGLRPRVAGACDALLSIPLRGRVQSLNVAAAGAVLMYEILQGRARA